MLGNALLLALRQIFRNPMRSILTVLGIVIGVAAVITMVTVGNGATQQVRDQIASIGIGLRLMIRRPRLGPGVCRCADLSKNRMRKPWRHKSPVSKR